MIVSKLFTLNADFSKIFYVTKLTRQNVQKFPNFRQKNVVVSQD